MIPSSTQHPLPRDGTSQPQRVPEALDPARRLLDDRDLDDLLVQLRRVAGFLTYRDLSNQPRGTWEPLLAPHLAVRVATLAQVDPAALRSRAAALVAELDPDLPEAREEAIRRRFRFCGEELRALDRELESLRSSAFGPLLERNAFTRLRPPLARLAAVIGAAPEPERHRWRESLRGWLPGAGWAPELTTGGAAPDVTTPAEVLAAMDRALAALVEALAQFHERAAADATAFLAGTSLEDGSQPPHLGLLLAWLRLFRQAQDALNDLVRRHLDFYYRTQLGLAPQPAVPDRAYAVVEPARNASDLRLARDTRLYGGKDAAKAVVEFGLSRDLVVNRAAVVEYRSTFRDTVAHGLIRAAPVANSADGLGAGLPEDHPAWLPFGGPTTGGVPIPAGRWGLAVAAPVLRLTGGTKRVVIALELSRAARDRLRDRCEAAVADGAAGADATGEWPLDGLLHLAFTTTDGWWEPDPASVRIRFAPEAGTPALRVEVAGIPVDRAITDYSSPIHLRSYHTSWPLAELTRNAPSAAQPANLLDDLELTGITLACDVTGDRALVVANDYGPLDPAKPFQPFGASPTVNSSLYVGSAEILAKHLTALSFTPAWKDLPAELEDYFAGYESGGNAQVLRVRQRRVDRRRNAAVATATASPFELTPGYLSGGTWRPLADAAGLDLAAPVWSLGARDLAAYAAAPDLSAFTTLTNGLARGFVRFQLTAPDYAFGHSRYAGLVTSQVVAAVNGGGLELPNPPLSPTLLSLEAAYTATESRNLRVARSPSDTLSLFHVEPHGEWEVTGTFPTCVPAPPADGTFFLGLEGLAGGQEVALLFHLADGSGNPFATYPTLAWEYLADDTWAALPPASRVLDHTNDLRRTGITVLAIPADATREHSRMPAGRLWLRVVATGVVAAINRLYSVIPQAVETVFLPGAANDPARLAQPWPADSLTRLVTSNPAVKKVRQPLPSFGGRPAEQGAPYYRRVSERLRHRQRAIALWDYERLVLEAFPQLYKVKCVPHTSPDAPDSELAPGHVTVVVVPNLTENAFDPLRPAASQDLLAEINGFLQNRVSAHVRVHAVNPRYEEVQVEATIVLRPDCTDTGFYQTQAATDVTRMLTPWLTGDPGALVFDAGLPPSTILNDLEERPYVDYVRDFHVRQFRDGTVVAADPPKLLPTTERSLLVSAPDHRLTVLRSRP